MLDPSSLWRESTTRLSTQQQYGHFILVLTSYVNIIHKKLLKVQPFFKFLRIFRAFLYRIPLDSSSTRITSSPICRTFFHGIAIPSRFGLIRPIKPPSQLGTTIASTHARSFKSRSIGRPIFLPSQMLITSFCFSSEKLMRTAPCSSYAQTTRGLQKKERNLSDRSTSLFACRNTDSDPSNAITVRFLRILISIQRQICAKFIDVKCKFKPTII